MSRNNIWIVPAAGALALASVVTSASVSVYRDGDGTATAKATPEMVKEFNVWINSFLFSEGVFEWTGDVMGPKAAHYFLTYVRNFLGGSILYYVTASCWHW